MCKGFSFRTHSCLFSFHSESHSHNTFTQDMQSMITDVSLFWYLCTCITYLHSLLSWLTVSSLHCPPTWLDFYQCLSAEAPATISETFSYTTKASIWRKENGRSQVDFFRWTSCIIYFTSSCLKSWDHFLKLCWTFPSIHSSRTQRILTHNRAYI